MVLQVFLLFGIGRLLIFFVPMCPHSLDWLIPEKVKTLILDPQIDWLLLKSVMIIMLCFIPLGYILIGLKVYKRHLTEIKIPPYQSSAYFAEKITLKVCT